MSTTITREALAEFVANLPDSAFLPIGDSVKNLDAQMNALVLARSVDASGFDAGIKKYFPAGAERYRILKRVDNISPAQGGSALGEITFDAPRDDDGSKWCLYTEQGTSNASTARKEISAQVGGKAEAEAYGALADGEKHWVNLANGQVDTAKALQDGVVGDVDASV